MDLRSGEWKPMRRRGAAERWAVRALYAGAVLLLLAGCHAAPPAAPAPQPAPVVPAAPAARPPQPGEPTLGDLMRESDWRRRTADKLRRNP